MTSSGPGKGSSKNLFQKLGSKAKTKRTSERRSQEATKSESVRWTRSHKFDDNDDSGSVSTSNHFPLSELGKRRRTVGVLMKEHHTSASSTQVAEYPLRGARRSSLPNSNERVDWLPTDGRYHELGPSDGPTLVTHLPDVVVNHNHGLPLPNQFRMQAVLLFLDISGFTALCEKYTLGNKTGTEQLTKTLNAYLSNLVSEVITYDGDILKFAGDAILTMWRVDGLLTMRAAVEQSIRCALSIQRNWGTYETSAGVVLKVKIGIAAGEVKMLFVGNDEARCYLEMGRGIEAVNKAENMCEAGGDIVVSPTAWVHCGSLKGDYSVLADAKHVKVVSLTKDTCGLVYEEKNTKPVTSGMENLDMSVTNLVIPSEDIIEMSGRIGSKELLAMESGTKLAMDAGRPDAKTHRDVDSRKRLRKSVITHFDSNVIDRLKMYVAVPVVRKIEEGQPLDYLSEMRQVTIQFVNIIPEASSRYMTQVIMQGCFDVIYNNCKRMGGCVSKIFLFDKGCTYIVVFGLPGYKHENDSAHALLCAHHIFIELRELSTLIKQTSIGVTTGLTYCGVLGHNHRHEYTVIGRKVNMAARLMMYYPGKVICDTQTYYHSKFNKANFIVQEMKEMKGLRNVGTIREFQPTVSVRESIDMLIVEEEQRPIIGREPELSVFSDILSLPLPTPSSDTPDQNQPTVVVLAGEGGVGRTRLMESCIAMALKKGFLVMSGTLTKHDAEVPCFAVKMLLNQLFEFTLDHTVEEREKMILARIGSNEPSIVDGLPLLNDILNIKLPLRAAHYHLNLKQRRKVILETLQLIVDLVALKNGGGLLFAVDDSQFIDHGWEYMSAFARVSTNSRSLLLLTIRQPLSIRDNAAYELFDSQKTRTISLGPLSRQHLAAVACRLLSVQMIPQHLDRILRLNSMGMPSWVDLLLREYMFEKVIKLEPMKNEYAEAMVSPAAKYLLINTPFSADAMADEAQNAPVTAVGEPSTQSPFLNLIRLDAESTNGPLVCVCQLDIDAIGMPASIKGMIQAKIDRLEEIDQTLVKTAAILGRRFSRKMLKSLLQNEYDDNKISDSIQRIAELEIFGCATKEARYGFSFVSNRRDINLLFVGKTTCICRSIDGTLEEKLMGQCPFIVFQSNGLHITAYEMMLEANRRPLHMTAANFLEEVVRHCPTDVGATQSEYLSALYFYDDPHAVIAVQTRARRKMVTDSVSGEDGRRPSMTSHPPRDAHSHSSGRRRTARLESIVFHTLSEMDVGPLAEMQARKASVVANSTANTAVFEAAAAAALVMSNDKRHSQGLLDATGGLKQIRRASSVRKFSISPDTLDEPLLSRLGGTQRRASDETAQAIAKLEKIGDVMNFNRDMRKSLTDTLAIYNQIIEQYHNAGNIENTCFYMVEAASVHLNLFEPRVCYERLRDVNRIYRAARAGRNPFEDRVAQTDQWVPKDQDVGQMEVLIGQALFQMNELQKALPHLRRALRLLGSPQPRTLYKTLVEIVREWFSQRRRGANNARPAHEHGLAKSELHRLILQSICLSILSKDFAARGDLMSFKHVAQQMLRIADVTGDVYASINAGTCMVKLGHQLHDIKMAREFEVRSKMYCTMAKMNVRPENVLTLVSLYWTCFEMRLSMCGLEDAIDSGLYAGNLLESLHGDRLQVELLPTLIKTMIMGDRLTEASKYIDVLHRNASNGKSVVDVISRCWYYACCLEVTLYIGVRMSPVEDCISYSTRSTSQIHSVTDDRHALFSLASTLCAYYQRRLMLTEFDNWFRVAIENEPYRWEALPDIIAFLQIIECKLLGMSRALGESRVFSAIGLNRRNMIRASLMLLSGVIGGDRSRHQKNLRHSLTSIVTSMKDARRLNLSSMNDLKFIKNIIRRRFVALVPRMLMLQAYQEAIGGDAERSWVVLQRSLKAAESTGSVTDRSWVAWNCLSWYGMSIEDALKIPKGQMRFAGALSKDELEGLKRGGGLAKQGGREADAVKVGMSTLAEEDEDEANEMQRIAPTADQPSAGMKVKETPMEKKKSKKYPVPKSTKTVHPATADDLKKIDEKSNSNSSLSSASSSSLFNRRKKKSAKDSLPGKSNTSVVDGQASSDNTRHWDAHAKTDFPLLSAFYGLNEETPMSLKFALPLPNHYTSIAEKRKLDLASNVTNSKRLHRGTVMVSARAIRNEIQQ